MQNTNPYFSSGNIAYYPENNYVYKINELENRVKILEEKLKELSKNYNDYNNYNSFDYKTSMHMM